jgi:hypothetical protein
LSSCPCRWERTLLNVPCFWKEIALERSKILIQKIE